MQQQKYIRLPKNNAIIIFPENVSHAMFEYLQPVSAGFCIFTKNEVKCFGQSIALGLKAQPDDSFYATFQLYFDEQIFVDDSQKIVLQEEI